MLVDEAAAPVLEAEGERVVEPLRVPFPEVPLVKVPVEIGPTTAVGVKPSEAVEAAATAAKATRKMEGCILHVIICIGDWRMVNIISKWRKGSRL